MTTEGLTCRNLVVERSGTTIIRDVTVTAEPGQVTVILGANGAGKTTLLEALSGLVPAKAGTIALGGREISKLRAAARARAGLCHIEQGRPVFPGLTVEENLLVSAPRGRLHTAFELFGELEPLRSRRAGLLSGGEQQMLVIARGILTRPQVLLLDEVSLGLAPSVVGRLLPRVRALAETGMTIVLVEQFANLALAIGQRAYVLTKGSVAFAGTCQELIDDPQMLRVAYLNSDDAPVSDLGT